MLARLTNSEQIKEVIQYVPFEVKVHADYNFYWGKVLADIDDVIFTLKKNQSDADNLYLVKKLTDVSTSVSVDDVTKTITVAINQADFGALLTETYFIRIGILFDGETQYRDLGAISNGTVTIKESWIAPIPM